MACHHARGLLRRLAQRPRVPRRCPWPRSVQHRPVLPGPVPSRPRAREARRRSRRQGQGCRRQARPRQADRQRPCPQGRVSHRTRPKEVSPTDLVTVEAHLTDEGGGIGKAEWRISSKESGDRPITIGVVDKVAAAGPAITLKQAVTLDPGENTIELVAYNGKNLVRSVPARTKVFWSGVQRSNGAAPAARAGDRHRQLLGQQAQAQLRGGRCQGARRRAQGGRQAALRGGDRHGSAGRQGHGARNSTSVFKELAEKVRPRDVFVLYAAGHGVTQDGSYYFIPQDFKYQTEKSIPEHAIGQKQIQAWLSQIPARKSILIFDTCESGALGRRAARRAARRLRVARRRRPAGRRDRPHHAGRGGREAGGARRLWRARGVHVRGARCAGPRGSRRRRLHLRERADRLRAGPGGGYHREDLAPAAGSARVVQRRQFQARQAGAAHGAEIARRADRHPHQDNALHPVELLEIFKDAGGKGAVVTASCRAGRLSRTSKPSTAGCSLPGMARLLGYVPKSYDADDKLLKLQLR